MAYLALAAGVFYSIAAPISSFTISGGSLVYGNVGRMGGVLFTQGGTQLTVSGRSRVYGNVAKLDQNRRLAGGGALMYCNGTFGSILVTGESEVRDNEATQGAVVWLQGSLGEIRIADGSRVTGNEALLDGGAFAIDVGDLGTLVIEGGSAGDGCKSEVSQGGFLHLQDGGIQEVVVRGGSSLSGNSAFNNGGAVYTNTIGAVRVLDGSRMDGNLADAGNGGEGGGWCVRWL